MIARKSPQMHNRMTIKHTQQFDNKKLFQGDEDSELLDIEAEKLSDESDKNFKFSPRSY